MFKRLKIAAIGSLALVVLPISAVQADSSTPIKVVSSKTVTGSRMKVFVSGDTENSGPLWSAKIPTKMKIKKDYSGYGGVLMFKITPLVSGEEKDDIRINIALWSSGGKRIEDRTLYDWSPVSPATDFEYFVFGSNGAKPGKYFWVITTSSSSYEGTGELKVPVTIQ